MGAKLGENARAALITRGLAEMTRFAVALGAKPVTLAGLSGLGDLVLTCSSTQSRNLSLGIELGQGAKLDDILSRRHSVVEGVETAAALTELARRTAIDMPIVAAVEAVLHRGLSIETAVEGLLARPFRAEASK
jgi:glycerol-3-phosphate dehydrogenase (NAD(P)+)